MSVTIVIPTLNAAAYVGEQVAAIRSQTMPSELIVIDSSSDDGTAEVFRACGAEVHVIDRNQFHHGATRNLGASMARTEYVVFLTQDAIPFDEHWLESLVKPLAEGDASAAYSRQLPRPDAPPTECFARMTNYPGQSRIVIPEEVVDGGIRSQFFSNSSSAVRRSVLEEVGWFPTNTVQNEDMLLAATLLRRGHRIAYVAESQVVHSHTLGLKDVLRRYFDIGTVLVDGAEVLAAQGLHKQGLAYVRNLVSFLVTEGHATSVPFALAETAAKAIGLLLGRNYRRLGKRIVVALSSNPRYWLQKANGAGRR